MPRVIFNEESKTCHWFEIRHRQQKWQCKHILQTRANPTVIFITEIKLDMNFWFKVEYCHFCHFGLSVLNSNNLVMKLSNVFFGGRVIQISMIFCTRNYRFDNFWEQLSWGSIHPKRPTCWHLRSKRLERRPRCSTPWRNFQKSSYALFTQEGEIWPTPNIRGAQYKKNMIRNESAIHVVVVSKQ